MSAIGEEGMAISETFDIEVDNLQYKALITRFEEHFREREKTKQSYGTDF